MSINFTLSIRTYNKSGNPNPWQRLTITDEAGNYTIPAIEPNDRIDLAGILIDNTIDGASYTWKCQYNDITFSPNYVGSNRYISDPIYMNERQNGSVGNMSLTVADNEGGQLNFLQLGFAFEQYTGTKTVTIDDCGKVIPLTSNKKVMIDRTGLDDQFRVTFVMVGNIPKRIESEVDFLGFTTGSEDQFMVLENDGDSVTIMYNTVDGVFHVVSKSITPTVPAYTEYLVDSSYTVLPQSTNEFKCRAFNNRSPWRQSMRTHPAGFVSYVQGSSDAGTQFVYHATTSGNYLFTFNMRLQISISPPPGVIAPHLRLNLDGPSVGVIHDETINTITTPDGYIYKRISVQTFLNQNNLYNITLENLSADTGYDIMANSSLIVTKLT